MHTKEQLMELHAEHSEWQNKINFFKDEMRKYDDELSEVLKRNSSHETMAEVEHFQNQFIAQREVLDIMRHDFKQYENAIEHMQNHNEDKTIAGISSLHTSNLERMEQFEKIFHDLRSEFHGFVNKPEIA